MDTTAHQWEWPEQTGVNLAWGDAALQQSFGLCLLGCPSPRCDASGGLGRVVWDQILPSQRTQTSRVQGLNCKFMQFRCWAKCWIFWSQRSLPRYFDLWFSTVGTSPRKKKVRVSRLGQLIDSFKTSSRMPAPCADVAEYGSVRARPVAPVVGSRTL